MESSIDKINVKGFESSDCLLLFLPFHTTDQYLFASSMFP